MSKLTEQQKLDIIHCIEEGYSNRYIAKTILGSESRKSTVSDFKKRLLKDEKLENTPGSEKGIRGVQGINKKVLVSNETELALLARKGYSPEHGLKYPYPDGFKMGKVTIQRSASGDIERTWERMTEDQERQQEIIKAAIEAMKEDIPRVKALPAPKQVMDNLCNLYTLADAHVGLMAWGEESGDDWDVSIARKTLLDWMGAAIVQSPDAKTGVLLNLGDFLHFDGLTPVTPAHRHVLDADSRFTKVVRVSIQIIRSMIDMLLLKHENVHVINAMGNHDEASSVWLREMFYEMYKDEPRVTIDRTPDPYYCYVWGDTTLFAHHGHKSRINKMDSVLVSKYKKEYGDSKYVYAHCGHLHHAKVNETNLMVIEQHRTLAGKDSYASSGGWASERSASVITYHQNFGEVSRITINPDMLK